MTQKTKLFLNTTLSLVYQLTTIVCGFILPRFFLSFYGSEVNGLISSITQFLGFISLAECGVGAVVQSTLYKPLADQNMKKVSEIIVSAENFFRRIAYLLVGYTIILMLIYPFIMLDSFDYFFTSILIFVISISSFAQYYIGMTYRILLTADQLGFLQYSIHTVALILNTIVCVWLMKMGASVHIVKLTTSMIFLVQPILLSVIAKQRYEINYEIKIVEEPIKQKWNGLAQHIATVVLGNTDTVVLTLLSTLENVSIYAVYHLIVNGVKQIVISMTNGMQAMFGNMLARNKMEELRQTFEYFEWIIHTLVTFVFSITSVLIIPFVRIYTANITDVNYIVPTFAYMITIAQASYCIRLPYNIMVLAAGHYKQTQLSAIIEASINVVMSVILVFYYGLVGVAVGTFVAMLYRTVYLAQYLSKNVIHIKMRNFVKHLMVDFSNVLFLWIIVKAFPVFFDAFELSYSAWFVMAVKVGIIEGLVILLTNRVLYPTHIKYMSQMLGKSIKKVLK